MDDEKAFVDCVQLSAMVIEQHHNLLLICDVPNPSQCDFMIRHTVNERDEVRLINCLANSVKAQHTTDIVIYGLSSHPRFVRSAMDKRNRIMAIGFTRVFVYVGGLYLWIANWSFLSRDQFPITLSSVFLRDLNSHLPHVRAPSEADPQETWDAWQRFIGSRLLQTIQIHLGL